MEAGLLVGREIGSSPESVTVEACVSDILLKEVDETGAEVFSVLLPSGTPLPARRHHILSGPGRLASLCLELYQKTTEQPERLAKIVLRDLETKEDNHDIDAVVTMKSCGLDPVSVCLLGLTSCGLDPVSVCLLGLTSCGLDPVSVCLLGLTCGGLDLVSVCLLGLTSCGLDLVSVCLLGLTSCGLDLVSVCLLGLTSCGLDLVSVYLLGLTSCGLDP
ncbi:unnamed protein product, partial [Coregonus sp. 'balchen']